MSLKFGNFFWQGGRNCFLRVQRRFLRKLFLSAIPSRFSFVFWLKVNNLGNFGEKLSQGCQKCISSVQTRFCGNCLSTDFLICLNIFVFQSNNFWSNGFYYRQVLQNCILCVQRRFLSELFSLLVSKTTSFTLFKGTFCITLPFSSKKILLSTEFVRKCLEFGEVFWQDGQNCFPYVQRRTRK